ncbi:GNAT family N-acetyltransferase [Luteimonas sp. 8-5]|uniref:GNAT family N-acetyltransferase n=1 Tax=Luteimonas sp. 8-5 TaxID=3039387 RepID=UPI0024368A69|nr:GNAT family N-acetyltransferase [Luteimonas sp. 8-5]MDG6348740.1 GNAT family N-acetyltransferase [Luteimonas sp. 8-5]
MAARNRLPPWHEMIRVADGREILIRPIRPDDEVPLEAGLALLEPKALRHRFPPTAKLVRPDPRREFVIIASEPLPAGEAVVAAVARAAQAEDGSDADFAIVVGRFIAGMGLGRHLMRRLVRWARGKRLQRLCGDVPADNEPMLALAGSLGFRQEASDSEGYVRVVLDLVEERE